MRTQRTICIISFLALLAFLTPLSAGTGSTGGRNVEPNPFTISTTFKLNLPESAPIRIVVFDLLGRQVRVLFDGMHQAVKDFPVPWDGNDETGRPVDPGIYICTLFSNNVFITSVKVVKVTA